MPKTRLTKESVLAILSELSTDDWRALIVLMETMDMYLLGALDALNFAKHNNRKDTLKDYCSKFGLVWDSEKGIPVQTEEQTLKDLNVLSSAIIKLTELLKSKNVITFDESRNILN